MQARVNMGKQDIWGMLEDTVISRKVIRKKCARDNPER